MPTKQVRHTNARYLILNMGYSTDQITIWKFGEAPSPFQELSEHGGDEDWLALVPRKFCYGISGEEFDEWDLPSFLQAPHFAPCDVSVHPIGPDWVIAIGAHS